jgi:hypothetical protein
MSAFCVSLSHQRAADEVRGKFAITESALPRAFVRPKNDTGIERGLDRLDWYPLPKLPL